MAGEITNPNTLFLMGNVSLIYTDVNIRNFKDKNERRNQEEIFLKKLHQHYLIINQL